jgi:hypothetical protein
MLLWRYLIDGRIAAREMLQLPCVNLSYLEEGKKCLESKQGKWRLSKLKVPRLETYEDKAVGFLFASFPVGAYTGRGCEKEVVSLSLIVGA